ncbi:MAG: dual specificity protein phosphatase family protein [Bdellovibrionales bacterium]|nr:dual specificity protein phosphatase family protein [Bdellovibrionales bacterium]
MVAKLRYRVHTVSFEKCNIWQKRLALYTSGLLAKKIEDSIESTLHLRVDWLPEKYSSSGRMGITILPGRKDRNRDLETDINELKAKSVTHVVSVITTEEMNHYGVGELQDALQSAGLNPKLFSLKDQKVPSVSLAGEFYEHVSKLLETDQKVVVHCVGGLGRSGTLVADYLKKQSGLTGVEAMSVVRAFRSPRAIESKEQEKFLVED